MCGLSLPAKVSAVVVTKWRRSSALSRLIRAGSASTIGELGVAVELGECDGVLEESVLFQQVVSDPLNSWPPRDTLTRPDFPGPASRGPRYCDPAALDARSAWSKIAGETETYAVAAWLLLVALGGREGVNKIMNR
jgi:hypothetical protein